MRRLLAVPLLALVSPAYAGPPPSSSTPTVLPLPITNDLGNGSGCPVILESDGQSVAVGLDHNGPHNNPANTYIPNVVGAFSQVGNPTGFVPAVYGTAPLNLGYGGSPGTSVTTSTPSLTYVNPADSYAWYLRQSGLIPASRPIVITGNRQGAQPIQDWIDGQPLDMWTPVQAQYALLTAGFQASDGTVLQTAVGPCPINHVMWNGGQNNNGGVQLTASQAGTTLTVTVTSTPTNLAVGTTVDDYGVGNVPAGEIVTSVGTAVNGIGTYTVSASATVASEAMETNYASKAGYGAAWARYLAKLQALPNWSPNTVGDVAEMGTWAISPAQVTASQSTQSARNDFFRTMAGGCVYPKWTTTSMAGINQSTDNPGPHPDGYGSDLLGQRSFAADIAAHLGGGFTCSPVAGLPRFVTTTGAYNGSEDEVRNGVTYFVTGASLNLANSASFTGQPVYIYAPSNATLTANGTLFVQNSGSSAATFSLQGGTFYQAFQVTGSSWFIQSIWPRSGNQQCYSGPSSSYTTGQTLVAKALEDACYTFNGGTSGSPLATTLTATFGSRVRLYQTSGVSTFTLTGGSYLFPDGTTGTVLTLTAGQDVELEGKIGGTNSLYVVVSYQNQPPPGALLPFTVAALPACGATTKGWSRYVTDAAATPVYNATVASGGSTIIPVFCNGTNWTNH